MGANAQTTVPKYSALTVLPAASMNISAGTGIPVFASTVTRDAAFGGANKVLAEGQTCYLESTNVVQYYDGAAWLGMGGKIGQVVSTILDTTFSTSSTSMTDVTGLSVVITPTAATSKVLVLCQLNTAGQAGVTAFFGNLVRGSTVVDVGATAGSRSSVTFYNDPSELNSLNATFLDSPATTAATTYKIQIRTQGSGTVFINRSNADGNTIFSARTASTITVMEILA